jgi:hypothetical protein
LFLHSVNNIQAPVILKSPIQKVQVLVTTAAYSPFSPHILSPQPPTPFSDASHQHWRRGAWVSASQPPPRKGLEAEKTTENEVGQIKSTQIYTASALSKCEMWHSFTKDSI